MATMRAACSLALLSNDDYVPPNGESYNMFIARVRDALLDIMKNSDGKTIAIATHTGVAKNITSKCTAANCDILQT